MMMRLERLKVSFKSKMWLLVTCVTQGRDCLSLSGSLCFALFLPRLSSLTHFTSQGLPIAYPNPILPALFFFFSFILVFMLFHTTRIDIVCVCAIETMPTHKSETKENISTMQLDNSQVWFQIFPPFLLFF
jgi:hypothetical protein